MQPTPRQSESPGVLVAGHICLDIIPSLPGEMELAPGRLVEAGPALLATGGAVANTGIALHRLGVNVQLVGKLGDDLVGAAIRELLERHGAGLGDGMLIAPGEASSYTIILSPPGVDRMFIHAPGCNDTFGADDVPDDLLRSARLMHFGYPPVMARMYSDGGAELARLLRRAKDAGVTTSLDMSMPDAKRAAGRADWRAILAAALPYVDWFVPSVEELLLMLRRPLFERLAAARSEMIEHVPVEVVAELGGEMLDLGARMVALKAGSRGLYLRTGDVAHVGALGRAAPARPADWAGRELWAPCFTVRVAGTTGAGDATIAGLLKGLLNGLPPGETLRVACAVGACSVEATDAVSGVRGWEETVARIAAGWARDQLTIEAPGWRWDARTALWVGPHDRAAGAGSG